MVQPEFNFSPATTTPVQASPRQEYSGSLPPAGVVNSGGEPLPPFARNSETSRQAAIAKYDAGNSGSQRDMILRWIRFCGDKGATREEIQVKLGLSGDTVRPRVKELLGQARGWPAPVIRLSDKTRDTKAGRGAEVLTAIWVTIAK